MWAKLHNPVRERERKKEEKLFTKTNNIPWYLLLGWRFFVMATWSARFSILLLIILELLLLWSLRATCICASNILKHANQTRWLASANVRSHWLCRCCCHWLAHIHTLLTSFCQFILFVLAPRAPSTWTRVLVWVCTACNFPHTHAHSLACSR